MEIRKETFIIINGMDLPEDIMLTILPDSYGNDSLYHFGLDRLDPTYSDAERKAYNYFKNLGIKYKDNILIEVSW